MTVGRNNAALTERRYSYFCPEFWKIDRIRWERDSSAELQVGDTVSTVIRGVVAKVDSTEPRWLVKGATDDSTSMWLYTHELRAA